MTDEEIAQLQLLRSAATPGTWSWEGRLGGTPPNPVTVYAGRVDVVGELGGVPFTGHGFNLFGRLNDVSWNYAADLDLAVAAVNALPKLLDEVQRLRELVGERDG